MLENTHVHEEERLGEFGGGLGRLGGGGGGSTTTEYGRVFYDIGMGISVGGKRPSILESCDVEECSSGTTTTISEGNFVVTKTNFLKEGSKLLVPTPLPIGRRRSKSRPMSRRSTDLESIPEACSVSPAILHRQVTIFTLLEGFGKGDGCVERISQGLHSHIVSHIEFTSMENASQILRDSYFKMESEFMAYAQETGDPSGCCAATVMFAGDEVCVAHIGSTRALIVTSDGAFIKLTKDHTFENEEERARFLKSNVNEIPPYDKNEAFITRAFGDLEKKTLMPLPYHSVPDICQFNMNLSTRKFLGRFPPRSSYASCGLSFCLKSRKLMSDYVYIVLNDSQVSRLIQESDVADFLTSETAKKGDSSNVKMVTDALVKFLGKRSSSSAQKNIAIGIVKFSIQTDQIQSNSDRSISA